MLLTLPYLNDSFDLKVTMLDAREHIHPVVPGTTRVLKPFTPNRVLLTLILEGHNTITRRNESVDLRPGDAMILWPDEEIRALLMPDRVFRATNILFDMPADVPRAIFPEILRADEDTVELARAMKACAQSMTTGRLALAQIEFAAALLSLTRLLVLRREIALSSPVRLALDSIRRRPENPPTRDELAEIAAVSPSYLSHLVKSETGATISTHIQIARIARAREMIHETNLNFSEIARALDMELAHFSRVFKQVTGTSPRAYSRTARIEGFEGNAQLDK